MSIELSVKQLPIVQAKLVAPKGQTNKFGGYKYRSCEDILESVKPLLSNIGASISVSDDIVMLGDRFYVKATACITFADGSSSSGVAFAREPLNKKGMDEAQITGATSSYARKYALNGLLAIDDTKDADTKDNREKPKAASISAKVLEDFMQCKSMDELQSLWSGLDDKSAYTEAKNEAKARLA